MRAVCVRTGAVVVVLAATWAHPAGRAEDDVAAMKPAVERPRPGARPGIDLAAHVDINVLLPPNQWRIGGGLQNIVIAGGGRLVIDGNLTIGGEPIAEASERIQRTDETLRAGLRRAQRDRLAAVAADRHIPAARRRALELATEADIRRVMADVAGLRDRYEGQRANLGDEAWQAFQKDVQLCRRALADPFGEDSLFAAVLAGTGPEP